jgi:hypothetical protein
MASKVSHPNFYGINPSGLSTTFSRVGLLVFLFMVLQIVTGCTSSSIGPLADRPIKESRNAEQSVSELPPISTGQSA